MVLGGDVDTAREWALMADAPALSSDVVVPHRGSATLSSSAFIGEADAKYAIVYSGHRNQRGFPEPLVVER